VLHPSIVSVWKNVLQLAARELGCLAAVLQISAGESQLESSRSMTRT